MTLQQGLLYLLMGSTVCLMLMSYLWSSALAVSALKPTRARTLLGAVAFLGCAAWIVAALELILSYLVILRKPTMVETFRSTWWFRSSLSMLVIANVSFWLIGFLGARARRRRGKAFEQERERS